MHHGKEHMVGGHEREIKEMYESLLVVLEYFPLGNTTVALPVAFIFASAEERGFKSHLRLKKRTTLFRIVIDI